MGSIAENIAFALAVRGLSKNKLAAVCGLSDGYISRLTRNTERNPRGDTLDVLAAGLGVRLDWLMRDQAPMETDVSNETPFPDMPLATNVAFRLLVSRGDDRRIVHRAIGSLGFYATKDLNALDWVALIVQVRDGKIDPEDQSATPRNKAIELLVADAVGTLAEVSRAALIVSSEQYKKSPESVLTWARAIELELLVQRVLARWQGEYSRAKGAISRARLDEALHDVNSSLRDGIDLARHHRVSEDAIIHVFRTVGLDVRRTPVEWCQTFLDAHLELTTGRPPSSVPSGTGAGSARKKRK